MYKAKNKFLGAVSAFIAATAIVQPTLALADQNAEKHASPENKFNAGLQQAAKLTNVALPCFDPRKEVNYWVVLKGDGSTKEPLDISGRYVCGEQAYSLDIDFEVFSKGVKDYFLQLRHGGKSDGVVLGEDLVQKSTYLTAYGLPPSENRLGFEKAFNILADVISRDLGSRYVKVDSECELALSPEERERLGCPKQALRRLNN